METAKNIFGKLQNFAVCDTIKYGSENNIEKSANKKNGKTWLRY